MSDGVNSTESDILSTHIEPYIDDVGGQNASTETPNEGVVEETTQQVTDNTPVVEADSGSSNKDNTGKPGKEKEEPSADPAKGGKRGVEDAKGGLKLEDGTYVPPGAARRFYEEARKHERELGTLKTQQEQLGNVLRQVRDEIVPSYERQITELSAKVQAFQQVSDYTRQYNMQPEDATEAIKLFAAWKANPVATLQYILAEAKAAGHNIDGIGPGVDTMALQRMMDQRLAPLTADHERQAAYQQAVQKANIAVQQFFGKFPDARVHEELISRLMTEQNLSMESAYYELKLAAAQRNLQWDKPLLAQMQQGAAQVQQQTPQQGRTPIPQTGKPLPAGRSGTGAVATDVPNVAPDSASYSDIIREAMRGAGMNV